MRMSMNIRRAAVLAALLVGSGAQAAEVAGVRIDDRVRVGSSELLLNGAGVRSKLFVRVYVGALYAGQPASSAAALIEDAGPRRLVLRLLREMEAGTLHAALDDGLRNNLAPREFAELAPQAGQLAAIMKGIGKVREGDSIVLDFSGEGVSLALNGEPLGKVGGAPFSRALLKVWLGERPADASLKKALLGG